MRRLAIPIASVLGAAWLLAAGPAQAAWVWVYGGKRAVERVPEEGRADWQSLPDLDANGLPDPVVTHLALRLLDEDGQPTNRLRVGHRGTLEVRPEFGASETDMVTLEFVVTGPQGPYEVNPAPENAEASSAALFPPVATATIEVPEDLASEEFGAYSFTARLNVGSASGPEYVEPLRFEIAGKSAGQRFKEGVQSGVVAITEGASTIGREVGRAWNRTFRHDERRPGALRPMSREESRRLATDLIGLPDTPWGLGKADLSAPNSAAAAASPPERRVLVLLPHAALQPLPAGAPRQYDLGWLVCADLVLTQAADAPEPYAVTSGAEALHALRLGLDAEPQVPVVHVRGRPPAAGGDDELGAVPVTAYEVLREPPRSLEAKLAARRQPDAAQGGLVHLTTYVDTGGAVLRVECDLPVFPSPEAAVALPPAEETAPESAAEPSAAEPSRP